MVNPDDLAARGLRAYEVGRLLAALRVALVLVPVAALCLVERTGRETCACLALVLLGTAVWLRWRDRGGMEAVTTGLLAGSVPLLAGLVLAGFDLQCGFAGTESYCTTFSVILGGGAGSLVSIRHARWNVRVPGLLTASAIAGLAASLGCIRLGTIGVLSIVLGIALGSMLGAAFKKRV